MDPGSDDRSATEDLGDAVGPRAEAGPWGPWGPGGHQKGTTYGQGGQYDQ